MWVNHHSALDHGTKSPWNHVLKIMMTGCFTQATRRIVSEKQQIQITTLVANIDKTDRTDKTQFQTPDFCWQRYYEDNVEKGSKVKISKLLSHSATHLRVRTSSCFKMFHNISRYLPLFQDVSQCECCRLMLSFLSLWACLQWAVFEWRLISQSCSGWREKNPAPPICCRFCTIEDVILRKASRQSLAPALQSSLVQWYAVTSKRGAFFNSLV